MEQQGSPCFQHSSLRIDISVPKTAREVNSCWTLPSILLLLLFRCSGSPVAKHTWTLEAQIYLTTWFSVSPHLFRLVLWLYSTYALFAFLLVILHSASNYTSFQTLLYISFLWCSRGYTKSLSGLLFSTACNLSHTCPHTYMHTRITALPSPAPKKRNIGWTKIHPFGSGTSPNKVSVSVSAAWSSHWVMCPH